MIIVGEKINTSRKSIARAVEARDRDFIVRVAREQAGAGAAFIDVNAGTLVDGEAEALCWLVDTVQAEVDLPLCLDSPNPEALRAAMERHRGVPMVNSISLETDRYQALLPVVSGAECHLVALCMAQASMPTTVAERVEVGDELIARLTEAGIPLERIYVDPLVQPVSVDTNMGLAVVGAVHAIMQKHEGVHTICGLSNVSFGLPARKLINRTFLCLCMQAGLDAAILDPNDRALMATLLATDMLLGHDEYCERFIDAHGDGRLEDV